LIRQHAEAGLHPACNQQRPSTRNAIRQVSSGTCHFLVRTNDDDWPPVKKDKLAACTGIGGGLGIKKAYGSGMRYAIKLPYPAGDYCR